MSSLTVFLTNRECPWRCVFCDLWRHALPDSVAVGDLPAQLRQVLAESEQRRRGWSGPTQVKLYNAGSFFDPRAVPPADHPILAGLVTAFDRVVLECHPALVGERVARFRDLLGSAARHQGREPGPRLEVALGLESVNPRVYPRLNKQTTPERFRRAVERLRREGIDARAFVLVQPPFEPPAESVPWAVRAVSFAHEAGCGVVSLIPVRNGNGALEALQRQGEFRPPTLFTLESALRESLAKATGRGRVLADLWDLECFSTCPTCLPLRRARLETMNRTQQPLRPERCAACGAE